MSTPIPQPPGLPLLGNVTDVQPSNTWTSLKALAEKYGEIFQITVLGQKIVFVASAALAEEICDQKRFRKFVGGPIVEIRQSVHSSLFTAFDYEASWGVAHRIIAPLLTPQSIGDHFDEMRDTTTELFQKWEGLKNKRISPFDELNRLNLEATALCLYGNKLNGLTGPEPPMIKGMEDATSEAIMRPTRLGIINKLFYQSKLSKATRVMRDFASQQVEHRKKNPTERHDLLWVLMNGTDPETGKKLTEQEVIDEIVTMPIGSSTAPCLITTMIFLLCKNPAVVTDARAEIDSVVGAGPFTHDHLSKLPYIEGVVRESLRLSFAAPGFNIEPIPGTVGPVQLAGGKYEVDAKQTMIIVLAGVNRDPAVFDEPLEFKPDRMVGEKFDALPVGVKKWFGNGKRECIGKHYAWQWAMVVTTMLIQNFDFEIADKSYQMHQDGWFNYRPVGFEVNFKSRSVSAAPEPPRKPSTASGGGWGQFE